MITRTPQAVIHVPQCSSEVNLGTAVLTDKPALHVGRILRQVLRFVLRTLRAGLVLGVNVVEVERGWGRHRFLWVTREAATMVSTGARLSSWATYVAYMYVPQDCRPELAVFVRPCRSSLTAYKGVNQDRIPAAGDQTTRTAQGLLARSPRRLRLGDIPLCWSVHRTGAQLFI